MLTLIQHVENKDSSVRELLDFNTMRLDKLYGKVKTHEMEQEQRRVIYGISTVDSKNYELLKITASGYKELDLMIDKLKSKANILFEVEMDDRNMFGDKNDNYTLEQLQQLDHD